MYKGWGEFGHASPGCNREVLSRREIEKNGHYHLLRLRSIERINGAKLWGLDQIREVTLRDEEGAPANATVDLFSGSKIMLFFADNTPAFEAWGQIPLTAENLSKVRVGVDQDYLPKIGVTHMGEPFLK